MNLALIRDLAQTRERLPYLWWQHSASQSIPNATWTALNWDNHRSEVPAGAFTVAGQPTRIKFPGAYLMAAVVDVCFAANATGVRGVRFRQGGFPTAEMVTPAITVPAQMAGQHVQCAMQPGAATAGDYFEVFVYQNSGAALNVIVDGIQAPSLMACFLSAF